MKRAFNRKFLSVLVCCVVMITCMFSVAPTVSASYPLIYLSSDVKNADHYVGDVVALLFKYWPEYHYEKVHVRIYDSSDTLVASADKQFYNSDGGALIKDYAVTWDTTDYEAGEYKIYVTTEYYSFMSWRESPSGSSYWITLKDESERPSDGWYLTGGKWAYYRGGHKVTNEWMKDSQGWCYLGEDGYCVTNAWKKDSYGWCYLDENGRMTTNKWVQDETGWCYLGADGYCVTNAWKKDYKGWCYLDSEGRMATNRWVKDSQGWCYVGSDGYCVTNAWKQDSTGWCYLDENGRMATNKWIKDSQGWCYVGSDGYCVTNTWKKDYKGWCYLDENGRMATNKWVKDQYGWCYVGNDGYCVTGVQVIDGVQYTFDNSGVLMS